MPNSLLKAVRPIFFRAVRCADSVVGSVLGVKSGVVVPRLDYFAALEAGAEVTCVSIRKTDGEGRDGL